MKQGFVVIHRELLDWEWFKTPHMVHLFLYLILKANHEPGCWQGQRIERGQLITGLKSLSRETDISIRSLRTCLNRLKSTHEITIKSTCQFSLITIENYSKWQDIKKTADTPNDTLSDKRPTDLRQTSDRPPTTNNNNNNGTMEQDLHNTLQPSALPQSDDADAYVNSLSSSQPEPKVRTKKRSAPRTPRKHPVSIEDLPDEVLKKYSLAYPDLDVVREFNKCCYNQKAKNLRVFDAEAAFGNWLIKAMEFKQERGAECQR